ncbi:hemagglutinin repeat-containing protein [Hydromonas duriensis]|nr:hemagglutinin repeat-containing protein [Hydromonas duriensis]
MASDAALNIQATDVFNDAGLLQAQTLSLSTANLSNVNSNTNTTGIVASKTLNINATHSINNQSGVIAGNASVVQAGSINNSKGSIQAAQNLTVNANSVNNNLGNISSAGTLKVQSTTLNNNTGNIASTGDLTVTADTLVNSSGNLIADGRNTINASTLTNDAEGLVQGKDLNITADTLTNTESGATGGLIATNALTINATTHLNNATGFIGSKDLTLNANAIDNQSGQINVSGNASVAASSLNNQAGLVYAAQSATLNINSIDNSNTAQDLSVKQTKATGIQANTLSITGDALNNAKGQIVGGNISTALSSLDNQSGQVLGNNLNLSATRLSNNNGQLLANDTLKLATDNYTHQGTVQGNQLTELNLTGDFTNQGTLSSGGSLTIHTTGNVTNQTGATLSAADTLDVSGQNIHNETNATIVANHTQLTAVDTLTNDGTIDGGLTELRAGKQIINNSKIYGGDFNGNGGILIGTDTLTNNANAVIASRAGMNIGARQITNNVGGLIQSQGDLSVGRTLGTAAEGYATTGTADRIDNNSATIEVGGNVTQWNVAETHNNNTQFKTEAGTPVSTNGSYYYINGQEFGLNEARLVYSMRDTPGVHEVVPSSDDPLQVLIVRDGESFNYVVTPSSTYPTSNFGVLGEPLYKANPQTIEILNNSKLRMGTGFFGGAGLTLNDRADLEALGIDSSNSYNFERYADFQLKPANRSYEYLHQAYLPERTYTYSTGKDNPAQTVKYSESFTYSTTDPIWAAFGVSAPKSSTPAPTRPTAPVSPKGYNCDSPNMAGSTICTQYHTDLVQYNQDKPIYDSWMKDNLPAYLELNAKINAFNHDIKARTYYDWQMFTGVNQTTTPVVTSNAPAKIIVAGNMTLSGHITNDKSQIVIGGNLTGSVNGIDNVGAEVQQTHHKIGDYTDTSTYRPNSTNYFRHINTVHIDEEQPNTTVNLAVAETKLNAGAQALNSATSSTSNGSGAVNVAGQSSAVGNAAGTANADGSPVSTVPTSDGKGIRTVAFNGILPSNVMFSQTTDPALDYLIVTDPQFTNKQRFLSSDYMLNQFDADKKWQRIGDGYYEQKLINDQIITATGKRFIGDYSSNEAQYKALMNGGVAFGKQFGLTVGSALTPEQMSKLTTDIVWMVEQTVTLADGSTRKVLVPKVYLAVNTLDLKGDGTLIASKNNFLTVKGDVNNSGGTIAAFNTMNLSADNINNRGGTIGGNKGSDITLRATNDINNIGGTLRGGNIALDAGRTINSVTTTQSSHTGDMSNPYQRGYASSRTAIDQVARIQGLDGDRTQVYIDDQGQAHGYTQAAVAMNAGHEVNLKATDVSSAGSTQITAKDINLTTVDTGFAENITYSWTSKNKRRSDRADTAEVGTQISSVGDTTLVADNAIKARAATIAADGATTLMGDTVTLEDGRATHSSYEETYKKSKGFLSSSSKHTIDSKSSDETVGTSVIGDSTTIIGTHDVNIKGSTVFGNNGVDIASEQGNINISASEDRFKEYHYSKETKSGLGALGGVSYGKMSDEKGRTVDKVGHTGATIASLNGDVNLQAKSGKIGIEGSTVNAVTGDVNALAQNIAITDVHNTATEDSYTKFKSVGVSVSVSSPILDAAKSADTISSQADKAQGGTQIGALAVSGGLAAYNAYRGIAEVGKDLGKLASGASTGQVLGALGSVSITLGMQKSESKSHGEESTSQGSNVTAGGKVNLTATGLGKTDDSKLNAERGSDILIQGSTVAGQGGTHLKADDDIIVKAGESTSMMKSTNKSSGASIGVSVGAQTSLNIGVNMGRGHANGDSTTYTSSTVGSANSQTTFDSGDDTTITGGQVIGKGVKGTVGGDLTVTTLQDVNHYDAKQTSASIGVSIPLGPGAVGVSASFSNEKTHANTQSANQTSGVFAGVDGFDVNVKGQTELNGGVIASSADATKNSLSTGSLVTHDVVNTSDYDAKSMSASASYSGTDSRTGKQSGYNGWNAGLPSAMNAKDAETSTTRAGVSAGTVTITDSAAQQAATGQTAEQTVAGLNRDVSADAQQKTGVTNLYERDKEKIETGFAIVKTLGENFNTFMSHMAKDLDDKGKQPAVDAQGNPIMIADKGANGESFMRPATIAEAVSNHLNPVGDVASSYISQNNAFGNGGYGNIILTAIVGAASGNVTGSGSALIQNAAINVVRQYGATQIKHMADSFMTDGQANGTSETIRAALHAIAGCAGAAATGGDCSSAAAASAATVALNNLIAADTSKMTAEQKQAYSNLIGTLVAGVTTAVGGDAAAATLASKVEYENNGALAGLYKHNKALHERQAIDELNQKLLQYPVCNRAPDPSACVSAEQNKVNNAAQRTEEFRREQARNSNIKKASLVNQAIANVANQKAIDETGTSPGHTAEAVGVGVDATAQTGTEFENCGLLRNCTTGGGASVIGLLTDVLAVSTAVKAIGTEARIANAEAAAARAEASLAKVENGVYADAGANAYADDSFNLGKTEYNSPVSNAHFDARHGASTTLEQQYQRASSGIQPDGTIGPKAVSSRAFNDGDMLTAIRDAEARYSANPAAYNKSEGIPITFERPIGEGFTKGGGDYKITNVITVKIDSATGKAVTAFPNITDKYGIVKPNPLAGGRP